MERQITSECGRALVGQVREIALRLPEATEAVDKFGHTSFRVQDKPFVMMGESAKGTSLSLKVLKETQEVLLQRPGFTKTPYIGQHGWVSLDTNSALDWHEIGELITEGYLRSAPKRLQKQVMTP
ncbi:putative DNA-binding protein (MmcQ/YjbR family) [Tumebacillus sp. BK434]|uniref:MmcQ/YjbR family DNA-binding protein n=1 Tax=Tumebacillus sp. BK434 TaxID=2512169 RepID=UPI0010473A4F|nr:MmcQ/YjbR family DNA-binding protein [Tumebacillus sp. BK434]TCP53425.1 putative DNA-binding protein (MmcQ/YjbR family) [Tumebacillus sp. BK434]